MLVVGLTGGIGAGKSTVATLLGERGALIVDVDELGRRVLEPGGLAEQGVVARFGRGVTGTDGSIDRAALARVVFADAAALADLNALTHPAINSLLEARLAEVQGASSRVVALDMAVLVESRLGYGAAGRRLYDLVVVVEAPWELRQTRLVARGLSVEQAIARRDLQASDAERRAAADIVIANGGDFHRLVADVDGLWSRLVTGEPRQA